MIRPLINLFSGEYKGADYRKLMNESASKPEYKHNVKQLIIDGIEYYRSVNYEALESINGDRVWRPTKQVLERLMFK